MDSALNASRALEGKAMQRCTSSHLHQMLIYPFCKSFLLHSVSFICKKNKETQNQENTFSHLAEGFEP